MIHDNARKAMIDSQVRPNDVTEPRLIRALSSVAREQFVPKSLQTIAYSEVELETSENRYIWLARDFSKLLKAAAPAEKDIALVIAAGEGYVAAVLNELVETVIALEDTEDLVDSTTNRLLSAGADRVVMVQGKLAEGYPQEGPYNLIFVNGAVETVPQAWLDQLAENGRLAVVIGNGNGGTARVYTKTDGMVSYRSPFDASPPILPEFKAQESFVF